MANKGDIVAERYHELAELLFDFRNNIQSYFGLATYKATLIPELDALVQGEVVISDHLDLQISIWTGAAILRGNDALGMQATIDTGSRIHRCSEAIALKVKTIREVYGWRPMRAFGDLQTGLSALRKPS